MNFYKQVNLKRKRRISKYILQYEDVAYFDTLFSLLQKICLVL